MANGSGTKVERRVKPLVGHVGGHRATDCPSCLALAVAAYKLGKEDEKALERGRFQLRQMEEE
jgi:hypothetical protein